MKIPAWLASLILALICAQRASSQTITEGFANVSDLTAAGWFMQNNSTPPGDGWYAGDPAIFPAQSGPADSYILAYSGNTVGTGTISNWLLSPSRTLRNGDVITFYTRKISPDQYPDRLQVRISTSGPGTNVGTTATSVGDFTTLLLDINPGLAQGVYPTTWTQYTLTLSGLAVPVTGRIAFRYFVTDGGPTGINSELIGIDQFVYTPACPTITISPASLAQVLVNTGLSQALSQTGGTGAATYGVTAGALPAGVSLTAAGILSGTPSVAGTYTFTVTATDANGCTGTRGYTLRVCPEITLSPASLNTANIGTAYSQTITQTGSSGTITYTVSAGILPAGLTLSNAGVISGIPTQSGSFPVTIMATNANGCSGTRSYTITVGCVTTLAPFTPACTGNGQVTLTGGTPAGGVYSGTGVTNGVFNPTAGTQQITYTYTSSNGCTSSSTRTLVVNISPVVSFLPFTGPVCIESGAFTLTGGSPAGGVYSGTGVSNGVFIPSVPGVFQITYSITDNNCTSSQTQNLTVDHCSGTNDELQAIALKCYPNPVSGKLFLELEMQAAGQLIITIRTLHGQQIKSIIQPEISGLFATEIDLTGMAKGIYLVEAIAGNGQRGHAKIILQ